MLDKYLKNVTVIDKQTNTIQDEIIPPKIIQDQNEVYGPIPFSHYYFSAYFSNESKFMKDIFQMYAFLDHQIYLKITEYGLTFFNRDGYGKFLVFEIPYNCFSEYKTNYDFIFEISVEHFKNIFTRFEITGKSEGFNFFVEKDRLHITQQKDSYRKIAYSIPLNFSNEDHSKLLPKILDYPIDHPIDMKLNILAEIINGNPKFNNNSYIYFKNLNNHLQLEIDNQSIGVTEIITTPFASYGHEFNIPFDYGFFDTLTKKILKKSHLKYINDTQAGFDDNEILKFAFSARDYNVTFLICPLDLSDDDDDDDDEDEDD